MVAPFTGAWIEIDFTHITNHGVLVAPFTGAWIEIGDQHSTTKSDRSLPSRERGLK